MTGTQKRYRRLLIRTITLIIPFLILLFLEGGLRLISYGDKLKLFISNPREGYEQYLIVNPLVGKKYFQKFEFDSPGNDIFLKKKPEGTFRIFVMGSSTVVGFPYGNNLMFSRILHKQLEEAYPGRNIEVVNTAITAINSYTLLDFAGEIARHEPDAILIYAGHNEFYGAFGAGSHESMSNSLTLTRFHLNLMNFRLYQLLRNIISATFMNTGKGSDKVHGPLMKRIVANKAIPLDSDSYKLAMKRFEQNMSKLVGTYHDKEIPVFLSEVISNVKDIEPLSSSSAGIEDEALLVFKRASEAYDRGDYQKARQLYNESKDLDGVRFRASEEVNRIIGKLAAEFGTYKVPMIQYFQDHSPQGIIGNSLLTEHVHPNIKGQFIMADAFFSALIHSEIMGHPDEASIHPWQYHKRNWGYTELDSLRAHHMLVNLKSYWPFVPISAEGSDYRLSYRPKSKLDSMAFQTFVDPSLYLADLRLDLAKTYNDQGKYDAAIGEYEALLKTNPYLAVNYRDAASTLIWLGDLPLALDYFSQSLSLESSFYAHYRMGEIYLIKGDYSSSSNSFELAFSLSTDEDEKIKTLGKIYMAAIYGGQEKSARALANQLRKYNAAQYLKIPPRTYTYLKYVPYKTGSQVAEALQLLKENRAKEALVILEKSLDIYDSHVARRYMGEIYLQEGRLQDALEQFERVYDEFRFDPAFMKIYDSLKN